MSVAVDLHCHVLPALDDGARDMEDAIAMARQAEADGISAICATPHIRHDHGIRITELPERIAQLSGALRQARCPTRIHPGGEVAAAVVDELDDQELHAVSLGGAGRWILLEPDPGPLDHRLDQAVAALARRGFRAVVAHPERHLALDLQERLARLVTDGALVQATGAYLVEPGTQAGMLALARAGLIHVLGSDAHSARVGRRVALADALATLGTVGEVQQHCGWMAHVAPLAIVRGADVSPPFAPQAA